MNKGFTSYIDRQITGQIEIWDEQIEKIKDK